MVSYDRMVRFSSNIYQGFKVEPLDTDPNFFDGVGENKVLTVHGTGKETVYWQNSFASITETDHSGRAKKTLHGDTTSDGKLRLELGTSVYLTYGKVKVVYS